MEIQDAIHGYIQLDEEEKKIVDSPPIQRLRRIRQLGLTPLVYPSATHTRFQHSLGVMHLAGKFAESLDLDETRRKELRIAALLHDSGHGPFSHVSEFMSEQHGVSHEDFSCEIVDRLEDVYSVDKYRLHKIIRGELEIGQVVAGDIDADRMDYLIRDAHATGVEYGEIDTETIIRLAEIDSRRLVYDQKAVPALEALLTSRFHMIKTVYSHHTAEIAEKMLQRALEDFLSNGNRLEKIMRMDDYEAYNALINTEGVAGKLYSRIRDRRLFKRSLVWDEDAISREQLQRLEEEITDPREVEDKISEEAGVPRHHVIVNPPSTPEIEDISIRVKKNGKIRNMSEVSPIPEALTEAEWQTVRMNVYAPKTEKNEVGKAAEKVLQDFKN